MNIDRVSGSSREVFNRRIVFDVMLTAKFSDLRERPGFRDKLRDEYYARAIVEQLLAEFREEKERFNIEEEKYKRERIRQELLLSVVSTESIYSILKATAPLNAQGEAEITPEYRDYMASMIADSLRSEASSMTKSQLQRWEGLYPGYISSLLDDHDAKEKAVIAKFGKLPGDFTGGELDKLANEHSLQAWGKSVSFNNIKFPNLDLLGVATDFKEIKNDLGEILSTLSKRSDPVIINLRA